MEIRSGYRNLAVSEGKKKTHPEESSVGEKQKVVNWLCETSIGDITLT